MYVSTVPTPCVLMQVIRAHTIKYRMVEDFRGRNFRVSIQNENFEEKIFVDYSGPANYYEVRPQTFAEKTFMDGSKTAKKSKVFYLERFSTIR